MKVIDILLGKQCLFIDIEGTLLTSLEHAEVFDDVPELLEFCKKRKIKVFFTTNVGRLSRMQIVNILKSCNIRAETDQILNPTRIALEVLREIYLEKKKRLRVFLIGEYQHMDFAQIPWIEFTHNSPIDIVLLGASRDVTYQQLNFAFKVLRNGAKLIVIGGDIWAIGRKYDKDDIYLVEGAFAKMLEYATNVKGIYTGKQFPTFFEYALKIAKVSKDKVLLIDDSTRYISGANSFGIDALYLARTREKLEQISRIKRTTNSGIFVTKSLSINEDVMILKSND